MSARPSRLERITNLVLALLHTSQPLSLREIGTAVSGYPAEAGALRQAFERDKRTLRDEGIPIATERIDGDDQVGYRIIPESYYLTDLDLNEDEEGALAFALAAVRLEGGSGGVVLAKLGTAGAPNLPPVVVLPNLPALSIVQSAVRARSTISFEYRDRIRAVDGFGLVFKSGSWYLIGHDHSVGETGARRTFRIDRIAGVPTVGEPGSYQPPSDFDAASALRFLPWADAGSGAIEMSDESTSVVIDVDVREAATALNLAGDAALVRQFEDGSVRLGFSVGDDEAFIGWVLGLGDAVEVLEPPSLRAEVIERLSSVVLGGKSQ